MLVVYLRFIFLFVLGSLVFTQDDDIPPQFIFDQSTIQAGYFFISGDVDGNDLDEGDWVGAFNGDVCVGAAKWTGHQYSVSDSSTATVVPLMGADDTGFTQGYLEIGDIPSFKIYDVSDNRYYVATPSEDVPFNVFATPFIESISVIDDCADELGGMAFIDDCGDCAGGTSNNIENSSQDC